VIINKYLKSKKKKDLKGLTKLIIFIFRDIGSGGLKQKKKKKTKKKINKNY
jgi:hypothetical protein